MKTIICLLLCSTTLLFSAEDNVPAGALAGRDANGATIFLPLRKTDVSLEMTSGVIHAEVQQQFTNTSDTALEAIYVFPLPSEATVTGMELRIGDRIIRSVVQERAAAKETYEAAKTAGKKTALLEEERPNIFTTSIANFLPGETVRIRLTYIQPASYERGKYSLMFPMTIGPRYIPRSIPVPDAERVTPPLAHPSFDTEHRLSLIATISGVPVASITSNSHPISVEERHGAHRITFREKETVPNADLHLHVALKEHGDSEAEIVLSEAEDDRHALVTVFPPLGDAPQVRAPRDVLFLIDTSGSMSGESIGQAKAGLLRCLSMLHEDDHFTIVRFSSDYSFFAPELRAFTPDRREAAVAYVEGLIADGGTEMQKALDYTLSIPSTRDAMRLVVFLTDGAVGNEDSLFRLLDQKLGATRLFTFGIGSAPNEFLMRRMAEIGRGQSRFIHSHEEIGEVMAGFFQTLDSPVLTNVKLVWTGPDGAEMGGIRMYPDPCPDVFLDRPLQVVAELPDGFEGSLAISGTSGGVPVEKAYALGSLPVSAHPAIGTLFAREEIQALSFQRLTSHNAAEQDQLREKITALALKHQLITPFTSRVAVEEVVTRDPRGELLTVRVPTAFPRGWNPGAFFPTATDTAARMLIGAVALLLGVLCWRTKRNPGSLT